MKNLFSRSLVLSLILGVSVGAFADNGSTPPPAQTCTYSLAPSSVTAGWTAYKTTQKIGVHGSFKTVVVKGKTKNENLAGLVKGLRVSVDSATVDTGNPARDKTLNDYFFSKLSKNVSGKVTSLSEADHSFVMALYLNGRKKNVTFHYDVADQSHFKATGKIDILDFKGNDALQSLALKCVDLHKGPDGVSKTWSEVEIALGGTVDKSCK